MVNSERRARGVKFTILTLRLKIDGDRTSVMVLSPVGNGDATDISLAAWSHGAVPLRRRTDAA